jgi:PKD repeat protein
MMKTTINKIVVALVFLLSHVSIYGQYSGSSSDGAATDMVSLTSCPIPAHFNAYFGGNDGASTETLLATTCGISDHFYAYFGGSNDGAGVETLNATTCGIPPSFYAYFGGNQDGANVETIVANVCPIPPQFYAYFGGNGDGFSLDFTAPICPTQPPVADFTASQTTICVGQSVTFTDTSTNIPFVWSWSFPGGTPTTSVTQNPTVIYNTAGVYNVSLTATNYNGSNTKTMNLLITVTAIPTITATTPASRCDSGTVTLNATASSGTINWYADASGGTSIGSGASFVTPTLSSTTTFYVESASGTCVSPRLPVIATVNNTPTITSTTPATRCDSGTVTLSATSNAGSVAWYNVSVGGTPLSTSNNFVIANITSTTTYYVEATSGNCTSPRTAVIATVNTTPTITSTTPGSRCDAGSVTLTVAVNSGTVNWYNLASGGTIQGTGLTFTTPSIAATTTYYVEVTNGNCTSPRTAVIATVNTTPIITATAPSSRCDAGTVTLGASANAGTLNWYGVPTGGTILATGSSFTTPSISSSTTYYVEAVNGSCSSARSAVLATINNSPTITSTIPTTICSGETFTISATASAGTLAWYNLPTGGIVQGTGTSFSLSNWTTTTTFYVQATDGSCQSARIPVIVTVNQRPTNTSITPGTRCGIGTVTLAAAFSSGTISWFTNSSGGTAIATGGTFTTPIISASTTYYVEAENNGCISSSRTAITATVTSISPPTGNQNQTFCASETVGLLAVSGSNVVWYDAASGGNVVPNTTLLISGTTYFATQTIGGCESINRLAVTVTSGACLKNDNFSFNQIKIYPNPVTEMLTISNTEIISSVEIIDMLGRTLFHKDTNGLETQIDMSYLPTATYLVQVKVGDAIKTVKIIKK